MKGCPCPLGQYKPGIDKAAVLPDLEVQVSALRVARVARCGDLLTGTHTLAHTDENRTQVRIDS
jgi:hypothetical protein